MMEVIDDQSGLKLAVEALIPATRLANLPVQVPRLEDSIKGPQRRARKCAHGSSLVLDVHEPVAVLETVKLFHHHHWDSK